MRYLVKLAHFIRIVNEQSHRFFALSFIAVSTQRRLFICFRYLQFTEGNYIFSIILLLKKYLTIRIRARDFYEVIVDEGEAQINYHLIEIESE
jgi:hypothetical protein